MVKSGEEVFVDGLKKAMAGIKIDFEKSQEGGKKPAGDKSLRDEMRQLTKQFRSMQSSKMQDRLQAQVRGNIERRAELQQSTSSQFPNIAKLLTGGGAGSPVSMMGQMQKQATKPFKRQYEYQQSGESMKELGAKWIKGGRKDDDMRSELERKGAEHAGKGKRAKAGVGGMMGKRMQSLIGKTGKFMESSKGQGMMAGGMMGASILTMVIKKAMEASPMLQQMMKIMNVAMTLFLRPIGDFIGGMLKPIMLFFLREIAVPMLKKGKDFIKFGEAFGKNVLGFLLKPIETIQAAIIGAIGPLVGEDLRDLARNFDGIKEWMTEQKMNMIATDVLGEGATRQDLINMIHDSQNQSASGRDVGRNVSAPAESGFDSAAWAEIEAEFGTGWVPTLAESLKNVEAPLDIFRTLMTDASQNTYTYVKAAELAGASIDGVASGMGKITGQFTLVSDATGNVVKAMEDLENQITGGGTDGTGTDGTGATAETPVTTDTGEMQGPPEAPVAETVHWSKITASLQAMFAAAGQQIREGLASASTIGADGSVSTSDEYKTALAEYNELTAGGTQTVLDGIKAKFAAMEEQVEELVTPFEYELEKRNDMAELLEQARIPTTHELALREHLASLTETTSDKVEDQSEKTVNTYVLITKAVVAGYNKIKALLASMARAKAMSNNKKKRFQFGGMINEPIWGIGESGTEYTLGEAGPEMVTPMGKGGGMGIGPVTINVNVDSINSDVDLEKIKPIVERALLEVHSRRGII